MTPSLPPTTGAVADMGQGRLFGGMALGMLGTLMLSACQARQEMLSAPVAGYNHTSAAINRFSVNGASGPNLGAYEGGGAEVCCGVLPRHWRSGMKAVVEWQKDPHPYAYGEWKEKPFSDAWNDRMKEHKQHYSRHRAVVDIPQYGEAVCALQVHFLLCDQVRVSTTCYTPGNPKYPDQAYFETREATTCPAL
ncbi:DUF3304 domain-containing protein [Pseudomonas chlororaphis subsp. aurantiaca]|nr:DUF3304 domain-containing protein [Pseudomonas chlororaphis subsp. aurantiaca]